MTGPDESRPRHRPTTGRPARRPTRCPAFRRAIAVALAISTAACAARPPEDGRPIAPGVTSASVGGPRAIGSGAPQAFVIAHGWHTDLALPADQLAGPLAGLRAVFPGARILVFGFGSRVFAMTRDRGPLTLLRAMLPARGAVVVAALSASPEAAYGARHVRRLSLPSGADARLSRYLWQALGKRPDGAPRLLGPGPYRGSLVYAAAATYDLAYTCNSWTLAGLRATGLPVGGVPAVLAGQVLGRIAAFSTPGQSTDDRAKTRGAF